MDVGMCRECNSGFAKDEEYFAAFLASVISGSIEPDPQQFPTASRILAHNARLRNRIDGARRVQVTPGKDNVVTWTPGLERCGRDRPVCGQDHPHLHHKPPGRPPRPSRSPQWKTNCPRATSPSPSPTTVTSAADSNYGGTAAGSVAVTVKDAPGVAISETALTILEGNTGTYTVVLNTEPAGDVTVTISGPRRTGRISGQDHSDLHRSHLGDSPDGDGHRSG